MTIATRGSPTRSSAPSALPVSTRSASRTSSTRCTSWEADMADSTLERYRRNLVSALQGASNAAASNVSAPIDLINAGLGKVGLGSEEPLLGSAWMKRQGLTADPESEGWGLVGETAGNIIPIAASAKAPQIASALRKGAENIAVPTSAANLQRGAINLGEKAPRMSKGEAEAAGYWPRVGVGQKLSRPVSEMTSTKVDVPGAMVERKVISPEDLQGSVLVPAIGDRSQAGKYLTHVNEQALSNPVLLEGGADFMRMQQPYGSAWASDKGPITALAKRIRGASEAGQDVYMPHVAMGHEATNFNTMLSETLANMLRTAEISPKARTAFNAEVRQLRPEFLGIEPPELMGQLLNTGKGGGELRKTFVNRMQRTPYAEAGFPDVAAARHAVTEPQVLDVPIHETGYAIAKMDPTGRILKEPAVGHSTYGTQLAGQYAGGLEQLLPRDVMFPDFYKGRRAM